MQPCVDPVEDVGGCACAGGRGVGPVIPVSLARPVLFEGSAAVVRDLACCWGWEGYHWPTQMPRDWGALGAHAAAAYSLFPLQYNEASSMPGPLAQ